MDVRKVIKGKSYLAKCPISNIFISGTSSFKPHPVFRYKVSETNLSSKTNSEY